MGFFGKKRISIRALLLPAALLVLCAFCLITCFKGEKQIERTKKYTRQKCSADAEKLMAESAEVLHPSNASNPTIDFYSLMPKALKLYERALEKDENCDSAYVFMGQLYLNETGHLQNNEHYKSQVHKAQEYFEKALLMNPNNKEAYLGLAKIHTVDYSKAVKFYQKAAELDSNDAATHVYLGMWLFKDEQFEKAVKALERAMILAKKGDLEWEHLQARYYLGRTYVKLRNYDLAKSYLTESASDVMQYNEENHTYWGCPHRALGAFYSGIGKRKKAAETFVRAAAAEHDLSHTQFEAARSFFEIGDYDMSIKYIDRALKIDQEPRYYSLKGFIYLVTRDYKRASEHFEKAISIKPDEPGALIGKGHLAIINKKYSESISTFSPVLNWDNGIYEKSTEELMGNVRYQRLINDMAFLGMGWALAATDKNEEAVKHYDYILSHRPDDLLARLGKASCLVKMSQFEQAQKILDSVIRDYPGNGFALADIAVIQMNKGRIKDAENNFKKALLAGEDKFTCPYEGLGLIQLQRGDYESARKNFEKAIKINPEIDYKKFNGLAKIYINEGNTEKARALLQKSIENYPFDNEAATMLAELDKKVQEK